jgi:hypothetical protein
MREIATPSEHGQYMRVHRMDMCAITLHTTEQEKSGNYFTGLYTWAVLSPLRLPLDECVMATQIVGDNNNNDAVRGRETNGRGEREREREGERARGRKRASQSVSQFSPSVSSSARVQSVQSRSSPTPPVVEHVGESLHQQSSPRTPVPESVPETAVSSQLLQYLISFFLGILLILPRGQTVGQLPHPIPFPFFLSFL